MVKITNEEISGFESALAVLTENERTISNTLKGSKTLFRWVNFILLLITASATGLNTYIISQKDIQFKEFDQKIKTSAMLADLHKTLFSTDPNIGIQSYFLVKDMLDKIDNDRALAIRSAFLKYYFYRVCRLTGSQNDKYDSFKVNDAWRLTYDFSNDRIDTIKTNMSKSYKDLEGKQLEAFNIIKAFETIDNTELGIAFLHNIFVIDDFRKFFSKYDLALFLEAIGIRAIADGKGERAAIAFKKTFQVYDGFHGADISYKHVTTSGRDVKDPTAKSRFRVIPNFFPRMIIDSYIQRFNYFPLVVKDLNNPEVKKPIVDDINDRLKDYLPNIEIIFPGTLDKLKN